MLTRSAHKLTQTGLSTGGQDGGEVEDLCERGMRENVVLHDGAELVAGDLVQAFLSVHDEEDDVVLVEPVVCECRS